MVCTLGRGRMAAMVRLLTSGSFPEITLEDMTCEKIAVKTIHKEFHDADEPNLLEEEDMHVFDCRPLTDPLHLVCCNACKKPVKASQYAAHAEHCRTLNSTKDIALELDGNSGHKKPPRKGRKNSQATNGNHKTASVEQEKSKSTKGIDVGGSKLNFDQSSMLSTQSGGAQRTAASVDHATIIDASGVSLRRTNHLTDAPIPLAAKIYHSRGSHRLRADLGRLYHQASAKVHGSNSLGPESTEDKE